jgi:hypothetical protein
VLDGDDTLGGKFLDLLVAVLLPVEDIRILANTEGTSLYFVSVTAQWINIRPNIQ